MNKLKTLILLSALTALLMYVGQLLGGRGGLLMGLVFAGVMNIGAYWFSDKIALASSGARPVSPQSEPELHALVRDLAERAGLPMPKVYLIPEATPNAFATGRSPEKAAVAVTAGLLQMLDKNELRGVLAHELAHVQNRDTLIMTVAATVGGALSMIADMAMWGAMLGRGQNQSEQEGGGHPLAGLLGVMLAPFVAMLIQMSISRTREFMADEAGARITRDPLSLASALAKIDGWSKRMPMSHATPATAHLYIINPLVGGGLASLFSTHPATRERIKRLEKMAADPQFVFAN